MSLELFRDDHMKDYAKSIRSIQKIIKNHPYISSLKFLSLKFMVFNPFELHKPLGKDESPKDSSPFGPF
jgi:hypothetical protein